MAKKEKGFLAGLSDEMVAAAKAYLFEMNGATSPELQRGMDFHKMVDKAHPATQPTLRAVVSQWIDAHMPIGAKSAPFNRENPQPWWQYDPLTGQKIDVSAEGRFIAEQGGLGRQDVIDITKPIKGGYTPPEQRSPDVRYLEPGEEVVIPPDRPAPPPAHLDPDIYRAQQEAAEKEVG